MMTANFELEEGEAHDCMGDEDNVNPDTDLSYIDEKVQDILGHHLKSFDGASSTDNLGPKFGPYGSFLPTYERSHSIHSCIKTPQKDSTVQRLLNNKSMEGTSQDLKPTSNAPHSARVGTASCSENSLQNRGMLPEGVSMKHDLPLSSAHVAEKFNGKGGSSNKSRSLTNQKMLRVRIKTSSDKMVCKNLAIYSGLGLDNSPSSSLENSAGESGGQDDVPQETADESLTSILQVMTSFVVPDGVLISPLHEDLLCLLGKDSGDWESLPPVNGSQVNSAFLVDESIASMHNGEILKEKANLVDKRERQGELKNVTDMKYKSDKTFLLKKKKGIETPGGKEINSNALRCTAVANSVYFFGPLKGTLEDSLESTSGQENSRGQTNSKSSSVERVWEQGGVNPKNDVLHCRAENGRCKGNNASTSLNSQSDGSKCNESAIAPPKQKAGKKHAIDVKDKLDEYGGRTNSFVEGKGSQSSQSRQKAAGLSRKGSLRDGTSTAPKDMSTTYDSSTCKSKVHKLKPQKDINKVRDIRNDSLVANSEQRNNPLERQFSCQPNDSTPNNLEVELKHNAILDKSKEKFSTKVANHAMSEPFIKEAPIGGPCNLEGRQGAEMVPAVANPIVIEENWVCCDNCQKWRLLPYGTKPEQLPDNWLCSMLNWLPGMNQCDISEEETTKAVNAFYQLPVVGGQNNMQNYGNGTASVTTLAHGRQHDQKHRGLSSAAVSICGKKNNGLKEIPKAGGSGRIQTSKSTKNNLQDYVKGRRVNDMNKTLTESKAMKKPNSLHINMSCTLDAEKYKSKLKEKQGIEGDVKQLKIKDKRKADKHEYATSKKAKIEDMHATDEHRNSSLEVMRVGDIPSAGLKTKAGRKSKPQYESSYSEEAKGNTEGRLLHCNKKLGNQAHVLLDGGSLNMKTLGRRNHVAMKRKWQENFNASDCKGYVEEESSESGFGRENSSGVVKTEGKNSTASKVADNKSINWATPFLSKNCHSFDCMGNPRSVSKDQALQKPRRKVASKQTLDGLDLIRRVFGSEEASEAATSSSSKVLGSCKNGENFKEVKGSPVESVSSSPCRTFYPDKLTSAAEDILGKSHGGSSCFPVNINPESCRNKEHVGKINQSVPKKSMKYESEINVANPQCQEIKSEDEQNKRYRSIFYEDEKNIICGRELERQLPNDCTTEKQVMFKENHDSSVKLCASANMKVSSQQNLMQVYEAEEKVNHAQRKKRIGLSELVLSCQIEDGKKAKAHQSLQGSLGRGMFEVSLTDSCKGDVSEASNHPETVDKRNGSHRSLLHCTPNVQGIKDLNASSSRTMKFSMQNASNALKEAKELGAYADRLKSSGFDFEGNEAHFQAALKFLHGAFLRETNVVEGGKNGEMTQIQEYNTAAKLCESCAHEYERCQEMAAAALAYKCMEVAYMRVVYCKHSSTSRDQNVLQATLYNTSQGESPSSSASDVDNLNNQVTADKATSSKGAVSYITGNHVIIARNRPNFIRLLDFTQDVNFALEASRKSQNAFAAANVALEEAQNIECIDTIKRVIDFSFQDVEGFLHLVWLAMEAVNSSGFGGARD